MVRLRGVGHVYDPGSPWEHRALARVDLDVDAGEAVAVHGPNGSGKSTLFWLLTGVLTPTEGEVDVAGRVGACLQQARLQLFGDTVAADLRLDPAVSSTAATRALETVGLDPARYLDRRVDTLSGGEQRLVALAGVLARRSGVVVLDEPFAGLDAGRARQLVQALQTANRAGVATVVLTPDAEEAATVGAVLELRDGRLGAAC